MHWVRLALSLACALGIARHATGTPVPHADEPALRSEHGAMLALAEPAAATHVAAKDGAWSDAATWNGGSVPTAGARVLVPAATAVTVDRVSELALRTVRVDGTLRFVTDRDTSLVVDTIVVAPGGTLEMGTPQAPVSARVTARIVIADGGEIDRQSDPTLLGRGLVSHGTVTMCGAAVTPFAALAKAPMRGDTKLELAAPPFGWKAGDRIAVTGTVSGRGSQDETLEVADVRQAEVTLKETLRYDHAAPAEGLTAYVANLSRNVIVESQNTTDARRAGHVMFMHAAHVRVENVGFYRLGRTEKLKPIDDVGVGAGTNPRGRYAVHFHRTGLDPAREPARVIGCAVADCPGWGFVNHSSNVDFNGNVAFNVTGSAFVTEAGDEIGAFRRNLAIRSVGSGEDEDARRKIQDFGHEGDGFWFQGGGVIVEDNVAAGQSASGFIYFTQGLEQEGLGRTRYRVANLWEPAWGGTMSHVDHKDSKRVDDAETVPVIRVPVRSFKRNVAFGCRTGFTTRFMSPEPARSVLADSTAWNCAYGVRVRYTTNLDLRNLRLISGPGEKAFGGVFGTLEGEQDIRYQNLRVEGWPVGIYVPEAGHHVIEGGYFANAKSIYIPTPMQRGRAVEIVGDVRFGPAALVGGDGKQYDIDMEAVYAPLLGGPGGGYRDPNVLFVRDATVLNTTSYPGRQLYYPEQGADAVPFDVAQRDPAVAKKLGTIAGNVPAELIGKTNRQLWESYGLALGGTVAPADARPEPRIHGLVGSRADYAGEVRPTTVRTSQMKQVELVAYGENKRVAMRAGPVDLRAGWNLVTGVADGAKRSLLVFAGEAGAKPKGVVK